MTVQNPPKGHPALSPYITVDGAANAIDFYKNIFGAKENFRMDAPDGKVGHAELNIGGSIIMLSDECAEMGNTSPKSMGGSPVMLHLYVNDADSVFKKALAAGATQIRPLEDQFYGDRGGGIKDPFGHKWWIATHVEDVSADELKKRHEAMMKEKAQKKAA